MANQTGVNFGAVQGCSDIFPKTRSGATAAVHLMKTVGLSHRKNNCGVVLWASLNECAKACIINNTERTRLEFTRRINEYNIACKKH